MLSIIENFPFVSIIIPVYNESACIATGLRAIAAQDYPIACMEVIIADGLSTDDTVAIIQNCAVLNPHAAIRIVNNVGKIVSTGMNVSLRQAKGDIVIRIDGHTVIAPDYVRQCVETLKSSHADNVGGRMNASGTTPFGRAVALATSTPFGIGGSRFHYSEKEEWVDTVYMGAWPRRVFEQIGLFDEELIRDQDDEFNYRLRAAGGRILLSPKIKSEYTVRSSPLALWRQYYHYGYWKVRVLQKHPRQMSLRQFVPPAFVLGLLGSGVLALSSGFRLLGMVVPLLYLLANLMASVVTSAKKGWRYLPVLPLVFLILHVSYGLGFLVGLVKFWNRWDDKVGNTPAWSGESVG